MESPISSNWYTSECHLVMHLHFRHKNLEIYTLPFTGKVSCHLYYVLLYFEEYFSHTSGPELNQNDDFEYETLLFSWILFRSYENWHTKHTKKDQETSFHAIWYFLFYRTLFSNRKFIKWYGQVLVFQSRCFSI